MLTLLKQNITFTSRLNIQKRYFWEYVNMMFNRPDPERIKKVGPDRACAEWVLRNGGTITWTSGIQIADYNCLPADDAPVPKLTGIDGTKSGISHYGFPHLVGCEKLEKVILHQAPYIDDRAISGLNYGKHISHVQLSGCKNITDEGLKALAAVKKLHTLVLFELQSVENLEDCKKYIKSQLPSCEIYGQPEETGIDDIQY